jgi:glutamate decarboxylase
MAIHRRDEIRSELYGDVYASHDLSIVMPKYKMPAHEHQPEHVLASAGLSATPRLR